MRKKKTVRKPQARKDPQEYKVNIDLGGLQNVVEDALNMWSRIQKERDARLLDTLTRLIERLSPQYSEGGEVVEIPIMAGRDPEDPEPESEPS